jgi:hypothetical protein
VTWSPTLFDEPTARATVTVEVGRRSGWIRGYGIYRTLIEADIPYMRCPVQNCLTIPIDRIGDLLALLEHRDRRVVELTPVDR